VTIIALACWLVFAAPAGADLNDGLSLPAPAAAGPGGGTAAWHVRLNSGARNAILVRQLGANRQWSPLAVLDTLDARSTGGPAVSSNGSTMLAAWIEYMGSSARVRVSVGNGSSWTAPVTVATVTDTDTTSAVGDVFAAGRFLG
jgi:hypothetical protein